MGTDTDARRFAQRLDNIVYPTLTKVIPGHFDNSNMHRNNSRNNTRTVTRDPQDQSRQPEKRCITCEKQKELANAGRSQNTSTSTPVKNRLAKKSKSRWVGRQTHNIGSIYNTSYEYDQMPLMGEEYAVPVQLTPHSETEIKPGISTPGTPETPGTTDTPKPRLRTKVRSTPSQPPVKKPTTTPPSKTSTPDQVRTITWQTFPDGTIVEGKQYTDWKNVE